MGNISPVELKQIVHASDEMGIRASAAETPSMLLALIVIVVVAVWLAAGLLVVALCRTAAEGDRHMRRQARRSRRPRVTPARFVAHR